METVIQQVARLNDVLSATGDWRLRAPTVVALGAQSSGKSSVLEALVGRGDFLPRGTGLVTRCPLELQLINVSASKAAAAAAAMAAASAPSGNSSEPLEWAEFGHIAGRRRFTDFSEVRAEILRQTERLAGANKGIVSTPIGLAIFSPRVPDLNIVDLPGMVKVRSTLSTMPCCTRGRNTLLPSLSSPTPSMSTLPPPLHFRRRPLETNLRTSSDRYARCGCLTSRGRTR